ncbi:MAG TPA: hypothetical protein VMG33_05445 [Steroidobacteraceae bacterium]|nr:hypothetical protein [Steroidobacteraceae bacterium]
MSAELSVFVLLVGALLVVAGALGRRVLRRPPSGVWRATAVLLLAAGIALAGWVGWANYASRLQSRASASSRVAPEAPAAPRGDPVPTAISALQSCPSAARPAPPPDAAKATREQLLAARSSFQQYDAATNAYLKCVDETIERVRKQFPEAEAADLATLKTLQTGAHNTAVDQEQAAADQLNAQVRAFKAQHPGS